ncbi:hypothetical protein ACWCQ1_49790 [Streptomyces sp. NPDC002144]
MHDAIEQTARAAAHRLAGPQYPTLAEDVEEALAREGATPEPGQYADPTALGWLVVTIANTAWMIYNDIRNRTAAEPDIDAITRRVRRQLQQEGTPTPPIDPAEHDRIINTAVEETLNAAGEENPEQGRN